MFKMRKDELRKELRGVCSAILILFDLWTSLNAFGVFGVITYFINKTGKYCHAVLGLHEVVGEYSSENMAAVLLEIFKDYRISNNIRYFMADNAELNDMYIEAIL